MANLEIVSYVYRSKAEFSVRRNCVRWLREPPYLVVTDSLWFNAEWMNICYGWIKTSIAGKMTANGAGAVFFLGSRAHYQVLEQPINCDIENGNASTETIYNASVEELWPNEQTDKHTDLDSNCNGQLGWRFNDQNDTVIYERTVPVSCVKRRGKRPSSEALLAEESKPAVLNIDDKNDQMPSVRPSVISFLSSLARRKQRLASTQVYLQHLDSVLNTCTYRESCRCLDCQGRYFECAEESDEYSSDEDFTSYNQEVDNHGLSQLVDDDDDEVFLDPKSDNDNTSTDLLLEDSTPKAERSVSEVLDDEETDKQLQMEVAASTSAMFNMLLYHPFSCSIQ